MKGTDLQTLVLDPKCHAVNALNHRVAPTTLPLSPFQLSLDLSARRHFSCTQQQRSEASQSTITLMFGRRTSSKTGRAGKRPANAEWALQPLLYLSARRQKQIHRQSLRSEELFALNRGDRIPDSPSIPPYRYSSQNPGALYPRILQLLLISSVIILQVFCALHGGCVAGDTCVHCCAS
jgi:hypothetical protein